MANDPGAYWDQGLWDLSKWDTVAANGGWTEKPDGWTSSFNLRNQLYVAWVEWPDVWNSYVQVTDTYSVNWTEGRDLWNAFVEVHPPASSFIDEKPDIWNALIYATLHPPIYGAGGGWGWSTFGLWPDWNSRRDVTSAFNAWRYSLQVRIQSKSDSWGGSVGTYSLPPGSVEAQRELMFGSQTFIDWEEEAILEELMK